MHSIAIARVDWDEAGQGWYISCPSCEVQTSPVGHHTLLGVREYLKGAAVRHNAIRHNTQPAAEHPDIL